MSAERTGSVDVGVAVARDERRGGVAVEGEAVRRRARVPAAQVPAGDDLAAVIRSRP
jgi:hypothetical protein